MARATHGRVKRRRSWELLIVVAVAAQLTMNAAPVNAQQVHRPPIAVGDVYSFAPPGPLSVAAPGVLANDSWTGNAVVTVKWRPRHGRVHLAMDGSFTYTPQQGFVGTDSVTYRIGDGTAWSAPVLVSIDVVAVNDPPFVEGEQYETAYETTLDVVAPGVLANDFDPIEFDGLSASGPIQGPAHGTVVLRSNGSFTYTPDAGYSGIDGFGYLVSDSQPGGTATVEITVGEP
jgi:hypothetical protein